MNHLLRDFAPLSEAAWAAIEDESRSRLTTYLAARKLVDFEGPHGWTHSATNLGHVTVIDGPAAGIVAMQRLVLPLVELRLPFDVSRATIDDAGRGALVLDLEELDTAVRTLGEAENALVFHGYAAAGITGITEATEHGGLLLLDHLRQILGGPVVWAPGVEGAVVLSLRGGDFVLDAGEDLSIGYLAHDAEQVQLYLEESISFRVIEPDAAVALVG
jgi:uncharacterized linocin/CFP29 family protein